MKRSFVLAVSLILALSLNAVAQRPNDAAVAGAVVDRQGRPAPGLTVFLVAQQGRSAPSTTDRYGRFFFANIPPGQIYYLEIYWGRDLMYRQQIRVDRDTNLGAIRL
jgi:hypothetical protein